MLRAVLLTAQCIVVAGIDRNANGMIAVVYSDDQPGEVIDKPTRGIYAIKKKRKQRKFARQLARQKKDGRKQLSNRAKKTQRQIARVSRREANCRHDRNHQNSRKTANHASVVVVEKLSVRGTTKSGKCTKEKLGKNVRQKAELNRVLLEAMLHYRCLEVLCVPARYTSQICSMCGYRDADNRTSLRKFVCVLWTCGARGPECCHEHIGLGDWGNWTCEGRPARDPDDPSNDGKESGRMRFVRTVSFTSP